MDGRGDGTRDPGAPLSAAALDRARPYKPLDVGNGLVAASVAPDGGLLSLISYDREHGLAELTAHPPFDESKRFEQAAVRSYRATLAHPSAPGFGVRPDLEGEWKVELLGAAVPRSMFESASVRASVTTLAPRGLRAVLQVWRFEAAAPARVRWRYEAAAGVRRPAYPQLTEGGPLPPAGALAHPVFVALSEPADDALELAPGRIRELRFAIGLGEGAAADASRALSTDLERAVDDAAAPSRDVAYARICALETEPEAVCILADHRILALSWNRDAFYVAKLLRRAGESALVRGHLRWLFRVAQRDGGVWGRAHLANGKMKDRAFQLDQQCYPLLEAAESGEAGTYRDEIAETLRAIERRRVGDLYPTEETPADDRLALPFHFSSHVLLWRTFDALTRAGLAAPDPERVRRATLASFADEGRFAYATDAHGRFRHYHDANDLPTALAPEWRFCDATDPRWRATIAFAWSAANVGGYYPGPLGGLGSLHTPHPWSLGDLQDIVVARALADAEREGRARRKLARVATWDDLLPEAYDEESGAVRSRHWFAWPVALRGLLSDGEGSQAAG